MLTVASTVTKSPVYVDSKDLGAFHMLRMFILGGGRLAPRVYEHAKEKTPQRLEGPRLGPLTPKDDHQDLVTPAWNWHRHGLHSIDSTQFALHFSDCINLETWQVEVCHNASAFGYIQRPENESLREQGPRSIRKGFG